MWWPLICDIVNLVFYSYSQAITAISYCELHMSGYFLVMEFVTNRAATSPSLISDIWYLEIWANFLLQTCNGTIWAGLIRSNNDPIVWQERDGGGEGEGEMIFILNYALDKKIFTGLIRVGSCVHSTVRLLSTRKIYNWPNVIGAVLQVWN